MTTSRLIAIYLPSLQGGGTERVGLYLARHFIERGFKVDLVLVKREGPYLNQVPDGVNVVDLKASRVLTSLPVLVRYLFSAEPAALLSALDYTNIVALWARALARVKTRAVVSVHVPLTVALKHGKGRGRLIPFLARWFYRSADYVVAVSRGVADDLSNTIGLARDRINVIHNPVIVPELVELAKESVDHPWFRAGGPPVILSVGRLTAAKDYPTLLRAISLVKQARPVRLVILGEGEVRGRLESMVRELGLEDVVSMPGFADNPYAYMSKASAFVLSSAWEGFGNVLVEAMAVGVPVVSTDCSGPAEILENGKYGRLVPVGNAEELAVGILATIDDPVDTEETWRRAQDFSYNDIGDQYLELLDGSDALSEFPSKQA